MNFDIVSLMMGLVGGGALGYFYNYNKAHTLQETLDMVRNSSGLVFDALIQERDLNEGLSQELAAQAKLVK